MNASAINKQIRALMPKSKMYRTDKENSKNIIHLQNLLVRQKQLKAKRIPKKVTKQLNASVATRKTRTFIPEHSNIVQKRNRGQVSPIQRGRKTSNKINPSLEVGIKAQQNAPLNTSIKTRKMTLIMTAPTPKIPTKQVMYRRKK
jgi:hypothetical protein